MASNPLVDSRDYRFVLFEMFEADKLNTYKQYADFDRDTFEEVLNLAETLSVETIYPGNTEADRIGVLFDPDTHQVKVPDVIKDAMEVFKEAGFVGTGSPVEYGGMGMPEVISKAAVEYFTAASVSFHLYTVLSSAAINLIEEVCTEEDKQLYLEKLISGQWGGTMCLTESVAGSDVGALKAKAVKQDDGSYRISGQKIFISSGDSDLYENIIHLVLARVEGDPQGTKGISIFLVPKYLVKPDGSLGERNDVFCTGIEHKMGIKASATCTLSFGDNDKCIGFLIGQQQQGMRIMFKMMNEARLAIAMQGLAVSSAAYMHAITYAKNRLQGTDPADRSQSLPIAKHPDIQRTLLWMKSYVEAMRMLCTQAATCIDMIKIGQGEEAKEAQALLDFLIPICKSGNSDMAWMVTAEAIQVYGGYGYCSDYPVEQLARDSKIMSIYEGTNGIQALDLTLRKLLLNPEMYNFSIYKKRIDETIERAKTVVDDLYISTIQRGIKRMDEVIDHLKKLKQSEQMHLVSALATPLQQAFVFLSYGWMHLWALSITTQKYQDLIGNAEGTDRDKIVKENPEAAYYYGKVLSSKFFIGNEFMKYFGLLDGILSDQSVVTDAGPEVFTGALEE